MTLMRRLGSLTITLDSYCVGKNSRIKRMSGRRLIGRGKSIVKRSSTPVDSALRMISQILLAEQMRLIFDIHSDSGLLSFVNVTCRRRIAGRVILRPFNASQRRRDFLWVEFGTFQIE